jgi:hypothetical protein
MAHGPARPTVTRRLRLSASPGSPRRDPARLTSESPRSRYSRPTLCPHTDSDNAADPSSRHSRYATRNLPNQIVNVPELRLMAGRRKRVSAVDCLYATRETDAPTSRIASQRMEVPLFGPARRLHIEPTLLVCERRTERHGDADCRPLAGFDPHR